MTNNDSSEKRPKTGFLHMNHSGNFRRTIKKPGFFSELNNAMLAQFLPNQE